MKRVANYFTDFVLAIVDTLMDIFGIIFCLVVSCAAVYVLWMFIWLVILRGEG